jgi:hypothetical protein
MNSAGYPLGSPYNNGSDDAVVAYNTRIYTILAETLADSLEVKLADVSQYYDLAVDVGGDNVHPDDSGHDSIDLAFRNAALLTDPNASTTDTATITETVVLSVSDSFVDVSDNITVSENTSVFVNEAGLVTVNVSDSITLSESVSVLNSDLALSVVDTATITETISMQSGQEGESLLLRVSDSITVSESIVIDGAGHNSSLWRDDTTSGTGAWTTVNNYNLDD